MHVPNFDKGNDHLPTNNEQPQRELFEQHLDGGKGRHLVRQGTSQGRHKEDGSATWLRGEHREEETGRQARLGVHYLKRRTIRHAAEQVQADGWQVGEVGKGWHD